MWQLGLIQTQLLEQRLEVIKIDDRFQTRQSLVLSVEDDPEDHRKMVFDADSAAGIASFKANTPFGTTPKSCR